MSGPPMTVTKYIEVACSISLTASASRDATIADFSRKSTITEEQLDLAVDYDSEVEDSLPPSVRTVPFEVQKKRLEKCIKELDCENQKGFLVYYSQAMKLLSRKERDTIVYYLGNYGLQEWFRYYVLHRKEPIQKLLLAFGVFLSEEQRQWDDLALLPLLKAAAFRRLRRRDLRTTPHAVPSGLQEHAVNEVLHRIKLASRIVVVTGAGISVSCGIPDFRSQNGLYSQLFSSGAYDLDDPQQMFDINFFKRNPSVFYTFAHKIYPSKFTPSPCHRFILAMEKRGKLLRNYTQNIDTLEAKAGIKRVLQCHGSFSTATCINCHIKVPGETIKDDLLAQRVPLCKVCNSEDELKPKKMRRKKKKKRNDGWESDEPEETISLPAGVMKPDITFFGEKLSTEFDKKVLSDAKIADLVLVIGTSLKVRPVSEIISHMRHGLDNIVINKTPLTHIRPSFELYGDADTIVSDLARRLGWSLKPETADQGSLNDASARSHVRPRRVPGASGQRRADIQLLHGKKRNIALYDGADCDEIFGTFEESDVKRTNIDLMESSSESELVESETEPLTNGTGGRVKKKPRISDV